MSNPNTLKKFIEIYLYEIRLSFEYLVRLYLKSYGFSENIGSSSYFDNVSLFSGETEFVYPIGYPSYEVFVDNIHISTIF